MVSVFAGAASLMTQSARLTRFALILAALAAKQILNPRTSQSGWRISRVLREVMFLWLDELHTATRKKLLLGYAVHMPLCMAFLEASAPGAWGQQWS